MRRLLPALLCAAAPVAAASLHAPVQTNKGLYNLRDYPQSAMRNDEMGIAAIRVTVAPSGKPVACSVIDSSDVASLDAASCAVMLARGSFTPARDAAGRAVYGVINRNVSWSVGLTPAEQRAFARAYAPVSNDIVVNVTALPAGLQAPLQLSVNLLVSPAGAITDCSADAPGVPPDLAATACAEALKLAKPQAARDASGTFVTSVQEVKLLFEIEPGDD